MWGFPAAFFFAAVLVPVTALFLYRRRSHEVEVPAVHLWLELGRPVESSSFATLLRRLLSLLTQLLIVAMLVVALADPAPQRPGANVTVIVLDVSATMQTREGTGETRMDMARVQAQRVLDQLSADGEVVILTAAREPVLALAPTRDVPIARKCLHALEALDVDGDLRRAVRSAAAFVHPRFPADVIVISDFAAADPQDLRAAWQSPARLRLVAVGHEQPDAAITALRSESDEQQSRVTAIVAQHGMTGRIVPVHLSVDNKRVATQEVRLATEPVSVTFVHPVPPGAIFEVEVDAGDALAIDDRAIGVLPRRQAAVICLVTSGNQALEKALAADPSVKLRVVPPQDYAPQESDSVVIFDGPASTAAVAPDQTGGPSGYLFINTIDPFGWTRSSGVTQPGPVTNWVGDHPALADIDPGLIKARRGLAVEFTGAGGATTELVAADTCAVITALEKPVASSQSGTASRTVRALYWMFDLKDSDLPGRLTFPLLLWNAIDYLVDGGVEPQRDSLITGSPIRLKPGHGDKPPSLINPAGALSSARDTGNGWLFTETSRQGLYRRTDPADEVYALNLLSSRGVQGLPMPDSQAVPAPALPPSRGLFGLPGHIKWIWILMAAAFFALTEWVLFNRRIIRIG